MPELPDVDVYIDALANKTLGATFNGVRLASPFLLRSVEPPLDAFAGKKVVGYRRVGKRIVLSVEDDLHLVLHLMIAGRLKWAPIDAPIQPRIGLAAFDFSTGTVLLREASKKKRASLYAVVGEEGVAEHDRGGLEPLEIDKKTFADVLARRNHTLKRALTDQRLFAGIGNAYSDEILHRARLSPIKWTSRLTADEMDALYDATQHVLKHWRSVISEEAQTTGGFPEKVTAFRDGMAVHGRYKKPCPDCETAVQRIRYASNEANYCPRCQTGGTLLRDRSLSRLLKNDWPRTIDELEARQKTRS